MILSRRFEYLISLFMGMLLCIPISYLGYYFFQSQWEHFWDSRYVPLIFNTLKLIFIVCFADIVIGFTLAWTQKKCDFKFKNFFHVFFVLPLAIPTYVGALTYIKFASPKGFLFDFIGEHSFNIYGLWGTAFVLTMFTYPYVYLFLRNAIDDIRPCWEEAHLILNKSFFSLLRNIHFPLLKNSMGSALILIALYVLSDFGAIALLRFNTFTTAIYYQIESFEHEKAVKLCFYLFFIASLFLYLKKRFSQQTMRFNDKESSGHIKLFSPGKYVYAIYFFYFLIILFSSIIPFSMLIIWLKEFSQFPRPEPLYSSIPLALGAAFLAVSFALPFSYLLKRKPLNLSTKIDAILTISYSLPSMILAISFILFFNRFFPDLYDGIWPLLIALSLRFLPQAIEVLKTQMKAFPENLELAHFSLEQKPLQAINRVAIPLLRPGIGTALLLVFVSSLKELPLAILLRPPGLKLLSTKIWLEANDAFYTQAAPYCFFLVLAGIAALPLLLKQKEQRR